ncbi:MAG: FecR domain-containing protein [Candidatus Omnitrophica bacterium]|nr:FecR domain-containing protein [Candidatus Omnitrophota bacterium]
MRCDAKLKELSLYIDGKLAGNKRQALDEHLAKCPLCKAHLEGLESLRSSLGNLSPIKESTNFDLEFNRLLDKRLNKQRARLWNWKEAIAGAGASLRESIIYPVPAVVKVAASLVLVVTVLFGVRYQSLQKVPYVEFMSGEIKIYRPSNQTWVMPTPDMRLKPGDRIHAEDGAILNIASKERYKMRVKDKSLIVISKLESGLRNIDTDLSISYGNILVNTTKEFKGSKMKLYTPACEAEVVGTAFMVRVFENRTWLGVLEGKVKIVSKVHPLKTKDEQRIATHVSSGQKARIRSYYYPTIPQLFTEKEWRSIQELYQLQESQQIMLLIGTGSNRIDNLLRAAPLYIPDIRKHDMPKNIQSLIGNIKDAIENDNTALVNQHSRELELLLEKGPGTRYNVELLMFIASHYHQTRNPQDAMRVFEQVLNEYPESQMAPLAQCAIATIYEKDLKEINKAERVYKQLLKAYPDSVDAIRAQEALSSLR